MATRALTGSEIASRIRAAVPDAVEDAAEGYAWLRADRLVDACRFLHDDRDLDGRFLNNISAIDCHEHFEVAYHVSSLAHNHMFGLKVRTAHDDPELPSVAAVWRGAHLQEREIYDLMGIRFAGHPDLKRLFLWDGFPGHPLRKDFLSLPGGEHPGLQRFPNEDPDQWGGEARVD